MENNELNEKKINETEETASCETQNCSAPAEVSENEPASEADTDTEPAEGTKPFEDTEPAPFAPLKAEGENKEEGPVFEGEGFKVFKLPLPGAKKDFINIGLALFMMMLMSQVFALIVSVGLQAAAPQLLENSWMIVFLNFAATYLVGFPIGYIFIRRAKKSVISRHSVSPLETVLMLLAAYAIMYVFNLITVNLMTMAEEAFGVVFNNSLDDFVFGNGMIPVLISTCIIAPIGEELIFRKLICDRTVRHGEGVAIVFSAVCFGLFHANFFQIFYAFGVGAFLAFIYVKTGKLKNSIIIHAFINFMGTVPALLIDKYFDLTMLEEYLNNFDGTTMPDESMIVGIAVLLLYSFLAYGLVIAGIIILVKNAKKIFSSISRSLLGRGGFSLAYGNYGVILFVIISVIFAMLTLISYATVA